MNFVTKILLSRYVKGLLDKLPFDGYKTYLSAFLFLLITGLNAVPSGPIHEGMQLFISIFQSLGIEAPTDDAAKAALYGVIVGLVHKLLKFLDAKVQSASSAGK